LATFPANDLFQRKVFTLSLRQKMPVIEKCLW